MGEHGAERPGQDRDAATHREVELLRSEIASLRRRVTEQPGRVRALEDRVALLQRQADDLLNRNERLQRTLGDAREQLVTLRSEVDRLAQPPNGYATFVEAHADGTVDVVQSGRKLRVAMSPTIDRDQLGPGQEVMLNEALNVVTAVGYERTGELVTVKELLGDDRALVLARADEERVVKLAGSLRDQKLRVGDALTLEPRSGYVYEKIPKAEVEELVLEEVPDIDYADIGGLAGQIEQIRDAVELPFTTPTCTASTASRRPRASCCTARPAAARR